MKISKLFFRKNQNYNGSRPQNPNKGKYQKPTQPPTKKPNYGGGGGGGGSQYQGGGGGNQYQAGNAAANAGAYGSGYGDPHFMVNSLGQDPICFDYNPPAGSEMTLIMDPENR